MNKKVEEFLGMFFTILIAILIIFVIERDKIKLIFDSTPPKTELKNISNRTDSVIEIADKTIQEVNLIKDQKDSTIKALSKEVKIKNKILISKESEHKEDLTNYKNQVESLSRTSSEKDEIVKSLKSAPPKIVEVPVEIEVPIQVEVIVHDTIRDTIGMNKFKFNRKFKK